MRAAFAEIFGRQTGTARGLGGSMHLTDPESGLIGSAGIVGGGLPIAVGAGLSAQMQGKGQLSVAFFGDGAANIGAFHESLNLASVWKLPVIFVCENNLYGEFTRIDRTTPFEELVRRADAYDMESMAIDGNDVDAVLAAARQAAELARSNGGPSFIECRTYRHHGHSRTDPAKYRPPEEVEYWMKRDPIKQYEQLLRDQDLMSDVERNDLYEGVEREVMQASTAAANDAWPEPGSYFSHVLAP
jgi:pyruvate dehydrogenase E1 component alpha subunit